MAWTHNKSLYWETVDSELGRLLSWLANFIATFIVFAALADFFTSWSWGHPILRMVPFIAAGLVWLVGYACRHFFSS
jgi:sensor histidine kinase YesM